MGAADARKKGLKKYGSYIAHGVIELYKDEVLMRAQYFHTPNIRLKIINDWKKDIRNLTGDFYFVIKLDFT